MCSIMHFVYRKCDPFLDKGVKRDVAIPAATSSCALDRSLPNEIMQRESKGSEKADKRHVNIPAPKKILLLQAIHGISIAQKPCISELRKNEIEAGFVKMGAYLHLQDLGPTLGRSETGSNSDSNHGSGSHDQLNSSASSSERAVKEAQSPSGSLSGSGSEAGTSSALHKIQNDCADFWAGKLDDVFEESQSGKTTQATESRAGKEELQGLDNTPWNGPGAIRKIGSTASRDPHDADLIPRMSRSRATECDENAADQMEGRAKTCEVADSSRVDTSEAGCPASELENVQHRRDSDCCTASVDQSERLPDHLLIELLVRVPTQDWPAIACVKKRWAQLFRGDHLWQSALVKKWPDSTTIKRWPGPIARGSSKRRYTALYISDSLFAQDRVCGVSEVAGHVYLFLKEQLGSACPPASYGLLHGTIIDQFLAYQKTGDEAHDLATQVWIAVLDNLDESENTFHLLMRIAEEWEVFLPYPYSKSRAVQWRLFERLFTDFRDCLARYNYFDVLTRARSKFDLVPQTWLGY